MTLKKIFVTLAIVVFPLLVTWLAQCLTGGKIEIDQLVNVFLTSGLVSLTAFYAIKTGKMTDLMEGANSLNFRPYLLIQGFPMSSLKRMTKGTPESEVLGDYGDSEYTFSFGPNANGIDIFLYSVKNLGTVPARDLSYEVEVVEVSENRKIDLPQPVQPGTGAVFPGTEIGRLLTLGKEVVVRPDFKDKQLELFITVKYKGLKDIDQNEYYTSLKLRLPVAETADKLNANGQSIRILEQDEGIIKK